MSKAEIIEDLDFDMGMDEVELDPEYIDMSAGVYFLRVAGFTHREIELTSKGKTGAEAEAEEGEGEEDYDIEVIEGSVRSIVFQLLGIHEAEEPVPEVGGIFSLGYIMNYKGFRDKFIRLVKKTVTLADKEWTKEKHSLYEYCEKMTKLYDREYILKCGITIRNGKYPELKTMALGNYADVENWENMKKEFIYAEMGVFEE